MPSDRDDIVIRVRDVVTRFGAQSVHDGIDLAVRRGEVLGIVGGSGTGKSVLLRTIIGLQRPAGGNVEVLGQDVWRIGDTERAQVDQHAGGRGQGWSWLCPGA